MKSYHGLSTYELGQVCRNYGTAGVGGIRTRTGEFVFPEKYRYLYVYYSLLHALIA